MQKGAASLQQQDVWRPCSVEDRFHKILRQKIGYMRMFLTFFKGICSQMLHEDLRGTNLHDFTLLEITIFEYCVLISI
jgi:hypothetical protein